MAMDTHTHTHSQHLHYYSQFLAAEDYLFFNIIYMLFQAWNIILSSPTNRAILIKWHTPPCMKNMFVIKTYVNNFKIFSITFPGVLSTWAAHDLDFPIKTLFYSCVMGPWLLQWKLPMEYILTKVSNFTERCPKYIRDFKIKFFN